MGPTTAKAGLLIALGLGTLALTAPAWSKDALTGPVVAARSEDAFIKAAQAAADSGDLNSAIAFYRRAADIAPKDPTPLKDLGALMDHNGSLAGAVEAYRGALARAPADWQIDLELGRLALRLDRPQDAIGHFETVNRERPESAAAWNGLGVCLDLMSQHARAQTAYQEGLKVAPEDATLRNNLGLSEALAGDYPAAIATLSALADSPQSTTRYRLNLALAYGLAGQEANAATAARRDLGEAEIASNRRYYETLRALGDHARTEAILGGVGPDAEGRAGPAEAAKTSPQ